MKTVLCLLSFLVSLPVLAIAFITEADVQKYLGADKVIEISKYSIQEKLKADNSSACLQLSYSKGARAYVVAKNQKSWLYVTSEDLGGLANCGEF